MLIDYSHPLRDEALHQHTIPFAADGDLSISWGRAGRYRRQLRPFLRQVERVVPLQFPNRRRMADIRIRPMPEDGTGRTGYAMPTDRGWTIAISSRVPSGMVPWLIAHEIGHTLGLEHPFETGDGDSVGSLDPWQGLNTGQTVMGYRPGRRGYVPRLGRLDVDALTGLWSGQPKPTTTTEAV